MDSIYDNSMSFSYVLDCMNPSSPNSSSPVSDRSPVTFDMEFLDMSANSGHPQSTITEGEIMLASNRPKKRAGRKKFKETRHPIYRGIRKRNLDRWVCEMREPINQKRIWLGTYPTADMAARAHDVAALALKGQSATLNFADSTWRLDIPTSKDPKEIRKAAMLGAEKFRPNDLGPSRAENEELEIENVFDMKGWAERPIFSPGPSIECEYTWDDMDNEMEVSLWNY